MKRFGLILPFFIIGFFVKAQKLEVLFYDQDWKLTVEQGAKYYRSAIIDTTNRTFFGVVKDYYANGQLQMKGKYFGNVKVDTFKFYHPNGQLASVGKYTKNKRDGEWQYFHTNGKLKQVIKFADGDFVPMRCYDSLGGYRLMGGNGSWEHEYREIKSGLRYKVVGAFAGGKRDGKWTTWKIWPNNGTKVVLREDKYKKGVIKGDGVPNGYLQDYFPEHEKFGLTDSFVFSESANAKDYPYLKGKERMSRKMESEN